MLVLVLAACAKDGDQKRAAAPPAPVEVTATTVAMRDVPVVHEFVGRTESSRKVNINARVDGFLEKRLYQEGSIVKEGQPLFLMDAKPFEARLVAARAALEQQRARLQTAEANLARIRPLAALNAVSQKDLDDAVGQQQAAAAAVESAKADVINAELNLGYTRIASPLNGVSSFAQVQEGAYVSAANSLLTTVSALSPMRVSFSVTENQILRARDEQAAGRLRAPPEEKYEVEIVLADGRPFEEKGRITFADAEFSESTGTFLIRAEFRNAKTVLRPGQFVTVRLHGAVRPDTAVVPKRAVQQGPQGSFVWVVGAGGKAEFRPVALGEWYGEDWVVSNGLKAGETVVVDGAIKLRPEAPVKVVPAKPAAAEAATGAAKGGAAKPAGGTPPAPAKK